MSALSRDQSRVGRFIYRRMGLLVTLYLVLLTGALAIAFAENHTTADRREQGDIFSAERDLARQYQACEQRKGVTFVLNAGLDLSPPLRAYVRRGMPDLLEPDGKVPSPDCAKAYRGGPEASRRFPDAVPTVPPFTKP